MIRETGHIVAVERGAVWVSCTSRADCQRCAEGRGCGGAILGRLIGDQEYRLRAIPDHPGAAVGDEVSLETDERLVLRASMLAYLLPLSGLLSGSLAGHFLAGEPGAVIGALAGLAGGWWMARRRARRLFAGARLAARRL